MRLTKELRPQSNNIHHQSATGLLAEFRSTQPTSFQRKYGIILNQDGTVFDTRKKICYSSLQNWAFSLIGN